MINNKKIAVIIPCFNVKKHILSVINEIPSYVDLICIVDDCCPENSGKFVEANVENSKIKIIYNNKNLGVGGAVIAGYLYAINYQADVIVKIDGDGQMDPKLMDNFISPILDGNADYCKGNRFYDLEKINQMPNVRIFGNSILSLLNKFSSGYWDIFDPTNGYISIHSSVAKIIPFKKISNSFFFETDMLFRLNILRAVVLDIPMNARYNDEKSNLKILKIFLEFLYKHLRNMFKRIFYKYYLQGMTVASFELPLGIAFLFFGFIYGVINWVNGIITGSSNSVGTLFFSVIPLIIGIQFILAFLSYDIGNVPKNPIHRLLDFAPKNGK